MAPNLPDSTNPELSPLERTIAREREVKELLGLRLKYGSGRLTVKDLSRRTGHPESSTYKHLDPESPNGLSFRDLDAIMQADPDELGREVLDLLGRFWGKAWRDAHRADPSELRLARLMTQSLRAVAEVVDKAAEAAEDGTIERREFEDTEPLFAAAHRKIEELRATMRRAAGLADATPTVTELGRAAHGAA